MPGIFCRCSFSPDILLFFSPPLPRGGCDPDLRGQTTGPLFFLYGNLGIFAGRRRGWCEPGRSLFRFFLFPPYDRAKFWRTISMGRVS